MHGFLRTPSLIREPLVPAMLNYLPDQSSIAMSIASMLSEIITPAMGIAGFCGAVRLAHVASWLNL